MQTGHSAKRSLVKKGHSHREWDPGNAGRCMVVGIKVIGVHCDGEPITGKCMECRYMVMETHAVKCRQCGYIVGGRVSLVLKCPLYMEWNPHGDLNFLYLKRSFNGPFFRSNLSNLSFYFDTAF